MDVPVEVLQPFQDRNLRFPTNPQLVPDLHFFDMPDGLGLQIRGGEQTIVLRGPLVELVVPWVLESVDGTKTVEELIASRPKTISAQEAAQGLLIAFKRGLIQKAEGAKSASSSDDPFADKQKTFFARNIGSTRSNANSEEAQARVASKRVLLLGNGLLGALTLEALIRSGCRNVVLFDWGVDEFLSSAFPAKEFEAVQETKSLNQSLELASKELRQAVPTVDLVVTATRNAPQSLFEFINQLCIENQRKWLRGNDTTDGVEVGPFVEPFYSACFTCMIARQACSLEQAIEEELYQDHISGEPVTDKLHGESIATSSAAAGHLSGEVIRVLTEIHKPTLDGTVLSIGVNGNLSTHRFKRVPRCSDCYNGGRMKISEQSLSLTV